MERLIKEYDSRKKINLVIGQRCDCFTQSETLVADTSEIPRSWMVECETGNSSIILFFIAECLFRTEKLSILAVPNKLTEGRYFQGANNLPCTANIMMMLDEGHYHLHFSLKQFFKFLGTILTNNSMAYLFSKTKKHSVWGA